MSPTSIAISKPLLRELGNSQSKHQEFIANTQKYLQCQTQFVIETEVAT